MRIIQLRALLAGIALIAAPAAERGTQLLGLFNAALARCPPGAGTVERGLR
ncbi:MAG TPA: hypothetical protein VGR86_06450 [Steroidobacteraceae bacterium]|nr:hypothetical protein [Steroidobacteraceae bacterium]HEV2441332.1 hypothetical protein [Steroidobacteraceae bacterium]